MSEKEKEFYEFMIGGKSGTFIAAIYQAIMRATVDELRKLSYSFNDEVEIYKKYSMSPGYWDKIKEEYGKETLLKG